MASQPDREAVLNALRAVVDPDIRRDIVTLGFVKDLSIAHGDVSFTIELTTPACPVKEQLREQASSVVRAVPGVNGVEVQMTAKVRSASAPETGRPPLPGVKNVIAVGAGKGGVGKTTVAVNLALALARCGSRVGLLDGDIYGPNIPLMLGLNTQLTTDGKQIVPAEKHGVQVVSIGFLTQDDAPIIWRGPMLHGAIQQFFREVAWRDLDYLIVDQTGPVVGSIVVTTPQQVSLSDSRRAVRMYQKLNIPTIGIVENMSYYQCTNCHHEADIFGHGGGEALAGELKVPFLGRLPLYQPIREGSDNGVPLVIAEPASAAARAFLTLAERAAAQVSIAAHRTAEANRGKIPLIPVR
jgi:ATP-binding protein involved in chromosome partitioning